MFQILLRAALPIAGLAVSAAVTMAGAQADSAPVGYNATRFAHVKTRSVPAPPSRSLTGASSGRMLYVPPGGTMPTQGARAARSLNSVAVSSPAGGRQLKVGLSRAPYQVARVTGGGVRITCVPPAALPAGRRTTAQSARRR